MKHHCPDTKMTKGSYLEKLNKRWLNENSDTNYQDACCFAECLKNCWHFNDDILAETKFMLKDIYNEETLAIHRSFYEPVVFACVVLSFEVWDVKVDFNLREYIMKNFKPEIRLRVIDQTNMIYAKLYCMTHENDTEIPIIVNLYS